MDAAARFSEVNLIADPLYGYIEITKGRDGEPGEQQLLDVPWLQRLRRIHQLQSAWWVFPTAEHSRFSHLLGAMHLAGLYARQIEPSLRVAFPGAPSASCIEETLRLAGLLHDVGHGPFGHFFDREVLSQWGIDHEDLGRRLVCVELADMIGSLRASPSGPFAAGESVDPRWVAWVMAPAEIEGYVPPAWLRACKPLLCGPATVDNLDYVVRDAYMCGVAVGTVDVRRIMHYSFVSGGSLMLHAHAVPALEMFLTARLYLYTNIYFHRTVRRIDLTMREIFADTVARVAPGNPLDDLDTYLLLTDWSLLEEVSRWRRATPGSEERRLGDAWERITARKLPWKLAYESLLGSDVELSDARTRILAALPSHLGGVPFEVDVASARVAPENPLTDNGLVAIYDPLEGTVEQSRAIELLARLPKHNQLVRVFTNQEGAIPELHAAARQALG
ncbi:MAG TPA: HD domain-containing protein [Candidatus Angelobacter sp.]|jgi:HD superfamily phosphohydrolase|nr:HD domain-containing protein [Candidatus Angelobacter sp.]